MSNITFADEDIKGLYKTIIREQRGLAGIILKLSLESDNLKIENIENSEIGIRILVTRNLEEKKFPVFIDIDLLRKKIYLQNGKMYQEVYDNYPKKNIYPIGHLYKNNEREIYKRLTFRLSNDNSVKYYELNENGNHYTIVIDVKNTEYNEDEFINKVLYNSVRYNNIRDLFILINEYVNTNLVDVKLADAKGSNITFENGKVANYVEYMEDDDQYIKIYLENGEFYYERKVKEPYEDNMTSYVKKLGEQNGKEKR